MVRKWVKPADVDEGLEPARPTADAAKNKEFEGWVNEVQRANAIFAESIVLFRSGGVRPSMNEFVGFIDEHRVEFEVEPFCE